MVPPEGKEPDKAAAARSAAESAQAAVWDQLKVAASTDNAANSQLFLAELTRVIRDFRQSEPRGDGHMK